MPSLHATTASLAMGRVAGPKLLCVGGEDHALRIPFMLALRDYRFEVVAAATGEPAPFLAAGIDYYRVEFERFLNPLADWRAIRSFGQLLADVEPDLMQTFDTKPSLLVPLAAAKLGKLPLVRTINGLGFLYSSRSPLALALRPVYRALQRLAARSTAVTVFQNGDDQALFMRGGMVGRGGTRLIPGSGIDIATFKQTAARGPSPARLRAELGLGGSKVVMTVSRLTREKGIPTLLEAAALVHKVRTDVRFVLIGPRQSEGAFAVTQAEIDRHAPYVMALGSRGDVPALLGVADLFAFPTEYREGVPRVLLEAAVAGVPIVTTRMPGCADVIRHGWNGILVPPGSPHLLAAAILDLLADREIAGLMAARAAQRVAQEFELQLTVARYATIYRELIDVARPLPTFDGLTSA